MTAADDGGGGGGGGGAPARRAIVRWSARLFRREWRQQVLILGLVAVAVAATVAGLALATNGSPVASTTYILPGTDPRLNDDVATITAKVGPSQVVYHQRIAVAGSVSSIDLRALKVDGPHPSLRLVSGRLPTNTGEVAITRRVAAVLGVRTGGTWAAGSRSYRVVGLVENPQDLHDSFALTVPGGADPPTSVSVIQRGSPGVLPRFRLPSGAPLQIEGVSAVAQAAAALAVLALSAMGLLFVGLVAVAGFTVVGQRHLRALGMLASLGANQRHIRLVMVANGAVVGVVGGVVGALVGVGGWLALAPFTETVIGHRIDRFALPWWGVGAAVLLAVLTALAAAWWPARSLSRMSVMASLSGRPPRPQPARRFAASGGALLVAGLTMLVLANPAVRPNDASHHGRLLLVVGILTSTVGLLLLAPLAIGALAGRAGRAGVAVRLAVRDLSRHRARSGAALGAVTLAVFIAVIVSITAAYQSAGSGPTITNLPANELLVFRSDPREPLPDITPDELRGAQQRVAAIASAVGSGMTLELDTARDPSSQILQGARVPGRERAALLYATPVRGGSSINLLLPLYVATPAVLAHDGIDPARIDPTADVVISKPMLEKVKSGLSGGRLELGGNPRHTISPKIQTVDVANPHPSEPVALLTAHGAAALGLEPVVAGWLLRTAGPITPAQMGRAARLADSAGLVIEAADSHTASPLGRDASIAGILLALGVLAMTVGLVRAESAGDLRILTATGAAGRTRRALTGATAGSLASLGVLLGVVGAYAEAVAWYHRRLSPLGHPPFANLVIIVVGLPVAATVGAWLLAGRQPPAIARRPIE